MKQLAAIPLDSFAKPLNDEQLDLVNRYWQAANYLSVAQIYLLDNVLLRTPLKFSHIKPRLLGHWGTAPGLNLIYVHLNQIIRQRDLDVIFVTGPGHGGPAIVANTYLEGTYSDFYPDIGEDEPGLKALCRQFSFPGGIPSHVAPETPGSIHEGGELGYALSHAFGAVFDNPELIATCVIGDGEAETGPLAAAWHSNKFLNPKTDGAVLPVLHLNGYKIANPTILARISRDELINLFLGYGYRPILVEGDEPVIVHQKLAQAMTLAFDEIKSIQTSARAQSNPERAFWPMIILRTPKGWTGPKWVDGYPAENNWRSHQVPLKDLGNHPQQLAQLQDWLKSYKPQDLFDAKGQLLPELKALRPDKKRQMGRSLHANGGLLLKDLVLADLEQFSFDIDEPGKRKQSATSLLGSYLTQVMRANRNAANFRLFGPDETASNRLDQVYQVSGKTWLARTEPDDENLSADGRVMEILSEHTCQGWLEGYLLTGRHGFFSCYEAFAHIVDSMVNQHAKWLQVSRQQVRWRKPVASLNYLLTSHVWRQDHNGFSHQDPGFIDHVANKDPAIARVYLPPDGNSLLCVARKCLGSRNKVNVIVAGKQPQFQWLSLEAAKRHCEQGLGVWHWASNDQARLPNLIMACAGDAATQETLAAVKLLRELAPEVSIRVVNVVNLMALQTPDEHPCGMASAQFREIFPLHTPVIFAFHGYPSLIHRLTYQRHCHSKMHVHGFTGRGTTTTPFDMLVLNQLDRFHLILNALVRVKKLSTRVDIRTLMQKKLDEHQSYIIRSGTDMPEIENWRWN